MAKNHNKVVNDVALNKNIFCNLKQPPQWLITMTGGQTNPDRPPALSELQLDS